MLTPSVKYRDFTLYTSMVWYHPDHDWTAVHVDYDLDDDRCFYGASIEDLKSQINDWYEEQDDD